MTVVTKTSRLAQQVTIHCMHIMYHNGGEIQGNETADTLAKEAATNVDSIECYKKVPKSVVLTALGGISAEKWQRE